MRNKNGLYLIQIHIPHFIIHRLKVLNYVVIVYVTPPPDLIILYDILMIFSTCIQFYSPSQCFCVCQPNNLKLQTNKKQQTRATNAKPRQNPDSYFVPLRQYSSSKLPSFYPPPPGVVQTSYRKSKWHLWGRSNRPRLPIFMLFGGVYLGIRHPP